MKPIIIGIAGGTGSGKTTLTNHLKNKFSDNVSVVYHDNYYKKHVGLTYDERAKINYDAPEAFDTDLMIEHLKRLKNGESVLCPVYDYTIHNRSDKVVEIVSSKVILVEGILIFENEELRSLMDVKIFVDTDADERIMRRIQRDVCERERSLESVITQYRTTVKPMHEKYVEPSKKFADIIVVGGGENIVALDMICTRVERYLKGEL
ncbi:MAG: uridine kinase [Acutalibacteraceae bacterium]